MRRRSFLTLLGSAGIVPMLPGGLVAQEPEEPWRFDVDAQQRWRLSRRGVIALSGGEITIELDGQARALAAFDSVRRFRTGTREIGAWMVVARSGDVEVQAEFLDADTPAVTVRVRGLGARCALGRVGFFDTRRAQLPALRGARAWINGRDAAEPGGLVTVTAETDQTGYWQLALLGGQGHGGTGAQGLALSFGESDSGTGEFRLEGARLTASAQCGAREVAAELPPAVCRLTLAPSPEPLAELGRLASRNVRLPPFVPAGWTVGDAADEAGVLAGLELASRTFDRRAFRVVRIGEGYQRSAGDWEMNQRFPMGHVALVERIHAAGFEAGLWLAPFAVSAASGIPALQPDWLLRDPSGALLTVEGRAGWGGRVHALDAEIEGAREHLRQLARHATRDWGYDFLELDHLDLAALGQRTGRSWSAAEAARAGIRALREGAQRAFLLGAHTPLQQSLGLVDAMRTGAFHAAHYHRTAWHADAGPVPLAEPLALDAVRARATDVALGGGLAFVSGRLDRLPDARLDIARRLLPAQAVLGRGFGADAGGRWMVARAGDRTMLAVFNDAAATRRLSTPLAAAGLRGPYASYDVWRETRGPDLFEAARLTVPAGGVTCLALRRPRPGAYVLGTTRHIVQAPDLLDETWDARRRILRGRMTELDGRPYAITIAVPAGLHVATCSADVPCEADHGHGPALRSLRLRFETTGATLDWEIAFRV